MQTITIEELVDLVVSDVPEADARIQKIFDWHYERIRFILQWVLGITASVFISILVAFFNSQPKFAPWIYALLAIIPIITGSYGIYCYRQLRLLHRQFIAALKLYNEFRNMRAFFVRYRQATS